MGSSKSQIRNPKQILMSEIRDPKQYDLEERTLEFSKRVIKFCKGLPRTVINEEIGKQLLRAATSVGANYIEANESLSKKDFLMRIKICRKEAKESGYWLKLIETNNLALFECFFNCITVRVGQLCIINSSPSPIRLRYLMVDRNRLYMNTSVAYLASRSGVNSFTQERG